MSLKSWWKRATKIPNSPRGILGNLVKNVSPFLALTPVGALGAGVAAVAGEGIRNKKANFGDLAKAGITNATLGAGLDKGVGLLKGASSGGAPAVASPGGAIPAPTSSNVGPLGGGFGAPPLQPITKVPSVNLGSVPKPGFLSRAATFASDHPNAVGMSLQGVGNLATAGTENRINEANARLLEQKLGESDYEFQQRRARDLALEPLRRALAQQLGTSIGTPKTVAPNPYTLSMAGG